MLGDYHIFAFLLHNKSYHLTYEINFLLHIVILLLVTDSHGIYNTCVIYTIHTVYITRYYQRIADPDPSV